jgi:hypothetical protein
MSEPLFKPPETRPPHTFCCICGADLAPHERPAPGTPGLCDEHARAQANPQRKETTMDPVQVSESEEPSLEVLLAKTLELARARRNEHPAERELSLVVTKLEEAGLWLCEWHEPGSLLGQKLVDLSLSTGDQDVRLSE